MCLHALLEVVLHIATWYLISAASLLEGAIKRLQWTHLMMGLHVPMFDAFLSAMIGTLKGILRTLIIVQELCTLTLSFLKASDITTITLIKEGIVFSNMTTALTPILTMDIFIF